MTTTCDVWATTADLCSPCDDYSTDSALMDDMLAVASDILYLRSGRRFPGTCSDTVRPYGQRRRSGVSPRRITGRSSRWRCSICGGSGLAEIQLGVEPIVAVSEVKVDGDVVAASLYRVDESRYLVRLPDADGDNPGWPCCQRMDLASSEDDTFEVSFTYGSDPPEAGVKAAAALACELYQACQPETFGDCNLPANVRSLSRQGVTLDLETLSDLLTTDTLSAIPVVRTFLEGYNPNDLSRPPGVLSPDIGPAVRHVGA